MAWWTSFWNGLKAIFGFAEQAAENKEKKIDLMEPKFIQKGINKAAILENRLKRKRRKWKKRQLRRQKD